MNTQQAKTFMATAPIDKVHGDELEMASDSREQWALSTVEDELYDGFINLTNVSSNIWNEFEDVLLDEIPEALDYANLLRLVLSGNEIQAQDLAKHLVSRAISSYAPRHCDEIQEALEMCDE